MLVPLIDVSSIARPVLTQGSQGGAGEGGKRGYRITLFYAHKNATSALLEGRGIELHSSTPAKMQHQHFWRRGVLNYTLRRMQKRKVSNFEYRITLFDECKNATSAILEGRVYRITLFHARKNAISAFLEGRGYQVTHLHTCKLAWSAILSIRFQDHYHTS